MKKASFFDKILLAVLGSMIAGGGFALTLFPAARFSHAENRLLAEAPAFSVEALADGSYTAAWDKYAAERFPGRRMWRGIRASAELAWGKREVGGVILGQDGSLLRRPETHARAWQKNRRSIAELTAAADAIGCPLTLALVPRRIDVCAAQLPTIYGTEDTSVIHAQLQKACPSFLPLAGFEEEEWFRTDHHWQMQGAYRAYTVLGDTLGYTPDPIEAFTPQTVSKSFLGTSDAAAGIPGISPDSITLLRYAEDMQYRVQTNGKLAPFDGFYDFKRLSTPDGYGVFLGGNYATLTVDRGENDTRPRLLLIKDSFANALIPFLARHFRILAVDPRYSRQDLSPLCAQADCALLLCGLQTLTEGIFLQ